MEKIKPFVGARVDYIVDGELQWYYIVEKVDDEYFYAYIWDAFGRRVFPKDKEYDRWQHGRFLEENEVLNTRHTVNNFYQ